MKKKILIGCSGYYYPAWKNSFYPKGVAASKWLSYYSSVFNTVELNGTFYRVPKLADLKKYVAATPAGFRFSVKVNKYITHNLKLNKCNEALVQFSDLIHEGMGPKLQHLLFQLPPSFHYNEENMDRVLKNIPKGKNSVVEFRHISWWNQDVEIVLKKHKLTFCNTDYPGLHHTFTTTNKNFYTRMHGVPELFKSPYSKESLEKFAELMPEDCNEYCIYFNNTYYGAAYENALFLKKLIEEK